MEVVGVSLGWNCEAASTAVNMKIRNIKENGYKTSPFDECLTNYEGLVLCIMEDFRYFCEPNFLKIIPAKFSTGGIKKGELLLVNTRYKFIFNHESPGHADLYISQKWPGGINHYVADNYKLFIERYSRRIQNFRNYLASSQIQFVIVKYNDDISKLKNVIMEKYPELKFNIMCFYPGVPKEVYDKHHILMDEIE